MSGKRRLGAKTAKNRELLVEAAGQVLCEEGYAAICARRVAEKAGLRVQLVHYYFESMDDLIRALVHRNAARRNERFEKLMASPDPLKALWDLNSDPSMAVAASELIALANHHETIGPEIVATIKDYRSKQIQLVGRILASSGVDQKAFPPAGVAAILSSLARAMGQDYVLGVEEGYAEGVKLVERALKYLSAGSLPASRSSRPK
jgi:AcrR family transcriptional regulator